MATLIQKSADRFGKYSKHLPGRLNPNSKDQASTTNQSQDEEEKSPQQNNVQVIPKTIELLPQGHTMALMGPDGPLLTITFASASSNDKAPHLLVLRGNAAGEEVASARFHKWTSFKADVEMMGKSQKVYREFESVTGMGKVKWEREGLKGMKMKEVKTKGKGEVIARFRPIEGGKRKKGSGVFEMVKEEVGDGVPVGMENLEEIVVSCLVERERMRREGEIVADGVSEVIMNLMGLPF